MSSDRERGSALHISKFAGVVMPKNKKRKTEPVIVTWFHPAAYDAAMSLSGNDRRRVHVTGDERGSVIVSNQRRRPDWMRR
jgi:hypothetical protein